MKKNILLLASFVLGLLGIGSCQGSGGDSDPFEISGNDVGKVIIGSAKIAYLEIKNTGTTEIRDLELSLPNAPFSIHGGVFPGKTGNCSKILAPKATCNIAIKVVGSGVEGVSNQDVIFTYKTANRPRRRQVTLQAQFKDLVKLNTSNIDFGLVKVGSSGTRKLFLKNDSIRESIQNVSFQQMIGSQFVIEDPSSCKNISPASKCILNVVFTPVAHATLSEMLTISYEVHGEKFTEVVSIKAEARDVEHISILNATPSTQVVRYGGRGEIELILSGGLLHTSPVEQLDIDPADLAAAGLQLKSAATTCLPATTVLKSTLDDCRFVFETIKNIKVDTNVSSNINIKYRVGSINKTHTYSLNFTFQIKKLELDWMSGHNFGTKNLAVGDSVPIVIRVTNPLDSSIANATNFGFAGVLPSPLVFNRFASTCIMNWGLGKGDSCTLVIDAKPTFTFKNFNHPLNIEYQVNGGEVLSLAVTVMGDLNIRPSGLGGPQIAFLQVNRVDFGQIANVTALKPFEVKLEVRNTGAAGAVQASNINLERYDPWGRNTMDWGPDYFIQYSKAKSTCQGTNLAMGAKCELVFEITPDPTRPMSLGYGGRKFRINYTDSAGNVHGDDFNLTGSWTFAGAKPLVAAKAAAAVNLSAPVQREAGHVSDALFSYVKRDLKLPANFGKYPQWVWNILPANLNHVPWTFKENDPNSLTKLMDIVPDRRVENGVSYILLYHGSTSEKVIVDAFKQGSTGIRFNAAQITALGDGFYLSADPNESKKYACDRHTARVGADPNIKPILLVVGIQEDPAIAGRQSWGALSTPSGDPLDVSTFFRRNDTLYNQFVFFSNVKPYLRIFEIITLKSGYGMSFSINDRNGQPMDSLVPDGNSYKCNY